MNIIYFLIFSLNDISLKEKSLICFTKINAPLGISALYWVEACKNKNIRNEEQKSEKEQWKAWFGAFASENFDRSARVKWTANQWLLSKSETEGVR